MTPEQINIALAEWAGWIRGRNKNAPYDYWWREDGMGQIWHTHNLPNYYGDLNAVHELEKKLTKPQQRDYADFLLKIIPCGSTCLLEDEHGEMETSPSTTPFALAIASAPQRCEALLKTLNLWKNDNG